MQGLSVPIPESGSCQGSGKSHFQETKIKFGLNVLLEGSARLYLRLFFRNWHGVF